MARGFGVLQYHEHAVAVEDGCIRARRLSGVPLPHAEALTKLTGLQALWLSENHTKIRCTTSLLYLRPSIWQGTASIPSRVSRP